MKTTLFLAVAAISLQAHAQFPYFLEDHNGNNVNYTAPVDIDFDGTTRVYSLHGSTPGPGIVSTRYSATTGAVIDVSYITRGNAALKPVRVRTLGPDYYILVNAASGGGIPGYCLISFNATLNTVNWAYALIPPTGSSRNAVDFVFDGANNAYILTNAYDPVNNQSDVGVTCVNVSAGPALVWDNVYQNTTRNESGSNIIYRSANNEVIVSTISADLVNPTTDRGPALLRLSPGGGYLGAMLYKYAACNTAEPSGTWVFNGTGNFYLSSTSYESGANGPLWLAKINPASLGITTQSNHRTVSAYLNPEIQPILTPAGTPQVLISGSSAAASGYVHLEFATATLGLVSGVVYPGTNPYNGSPIYDTYISTGPGMNIFSVADNVSIPSHYYLLKTSDAGRNDCEDPYAVTPDICTMNSYNIAFTQVPVTLSTAAPIFTISPRSNTFTQPCYVPFIVAPDDDIREIPTIENEIAVFPNPTKGSFTLSAGNRVMSNLQLYQADGTTIPMHPVKTSEGMRIDLTDKTAGIYVIQLLVDGEPKTVRVVLE